MTGPRKLPLSKCFRLQQRPDGWCVVDGHGALIHGPFRMRGTAEGLRRMLQRAANRMPPFGPRLCITCGTTFHSEGHHNRMCASCRLQSEAFPGVAAVAANGARHVQKH